jgi:hypothetical protein
VKFIDLAAAMGFEYCLVDNWWDKNIGRERIAELSKYAQSKGVSLMLWYNSNGHWNDAPQTPRNCMDTNIARDREMAWLKSIGVKGIKVDFFAGDKQETMKLYEDILYDATSKEVAELITTVAMLRAEWYNVPAVIEPEMEQDGKQGKNAKAPTTSTKK